MRIYNVFYSLYVTPFDCSQVAGGRCCRRPNRLWLLPRARHRFTSSVGLGRRIILLVSSLFLLASVPDGVVIVLVSLS